MYDFVDRNGPFDDNFNEPMYESWLHLQDANKTKAFSCELTVKWPFSHVETVNIMAPLLCLQVGRSNSCHYKYYRQIKLSKCTLWSKYHIPLQWIICIILFVITSFILNWLYSQSQSTSLLSETSSELSYSNSKSSSTLMLHYLHDYLYTSTCNFF